MSYDAITALLRQKIGLDASSIGVGSIERAVRERMASVGLPDVQAYESHVHASEVELQALIEAVVVPETWFFRDREAFSVLGRVACQEWIQSPPDRVQRALSLPCATGEEPYSMAMALLDAGLSPWHFQIDAIDISARVIAHAGGARYGKNSFRGGQLDFRDRYFEADGQQFNLREEVRRSVRFRQGNLFDLAARGAVESYDFIFCRNLLIYFDRPEQDRAVRLLSHLLSPRGLLFVGPSESGLLLDHGFSSARMPLAFAFHKAPPGLHVAGSNQSGARQAAGSTQVGSNVGSPRPQPSPPIAMPHLVESSAPAPAPSERQAVAPAQPAAPKMPAPARLHWMEQAQRLADAGKVREAFELCERHWNDDAPSAQAFYLLGLLHDSAGRVQQAGDHYRKALYLDPEHREAMIHLAMLTKKGGDARGAQVLMDRARRVSAAAAR